MAKWKENAVELFWQVIWSDVRVPHRNLMQEAVPLESKWILCGGKMLQGTRLGMGPESRRELKYRE
jgi:hypothetical protein